MSDDAMVVIARILDRGEALTVAAMLDAAGIIVHMGSEHYLTASPNIVALGGFQLTVPTWQYDEATAILAEMLAAPEPKPNNHMQHAIGRLALAIVGLTGIVAIPHAFLLGSTAFFAMLLSPLLMLQIPVNPQGRGDYYIAGQPG